MKKMIMALMIAVMCFASQANADGDARKKVAFGTVSTVNVTDKSFSIRGDDGELYQFYVNPKTEIEVKRKHWFDSDIKLSDMELGNWVKVEYFMMKPTHLIADEVNVYK